MLASDGYSNGINACWPAMETAMVVVGCYSYGINGCWPELETAMVVGRCWPAMETIMVFGGCWPAVVNTAMELMVAGQQ